MDGIYYRLYVSDDGRVSPVCMQWFDEPDYDQNRFLVKDKFKSEVEALEYISKTVGQAMVILRGTSW